MYVSTLLALGAGVATLAGCGSDAQQIDAAPCAGLFGLPGHRRRDYTPGISVTSTLGRLRAALVSAVTDGHAADRFAPDRDQHLGGVGDRRHSRACPPPRSR